MIARSIRESIEIKQKLLEPPFPESIEAVGAVMIDALKRGYTIFIAGNGGSAADAQHFAAELAGKFQKERKGLRAIALTTNTSSLTAISNDYSYEEAFSRQLDALGKQDDVFVGITTSGNSPNIVRAAMHARASGMVTVGLLGNSGGKVKDFCDHTLIIPSVSTPRIQECHILIIHALCECIDEQCS